MSSLMNGLTSADYVAMALAIGGLAAVLWEIARKDPRSLVEMLSDTRRFAERPLAAPDSAAARPAPAKPVQLQPAAAATQIHEHRLAA